MITQSLTKLPLIGAAGAIALMVLFATGSPVLAADTLAKGTFQGQSGHVTNGGVTIEKDGDVVRVVLGSDFSFDGAPDPKFAFAKDGTLDRDTVFAELKSNNGRQVYELPASIDPSSYDVFVLWCEEFSVPLGSAKLN